MIELHPIGGAAPILSAGVEEGDGKALHGDADRWSIYDSQPNSLAISKRFSALPVMADFRSSRP